MEGRLREGGEAMKYLAFSALCAGCFFFGWSQGVRMATLRCVASIDGLTKEATNGISRVSEACVNTSNSLRLNDPPLCSGTMTMQVDGTTCTPGESKVIRSTRRMP